MIENSDVEMMELEFMDVDIPDLNQTKREDIIYVDIQGFKTSRNRFLCKEFCLIDGDFVYHALIKSPNKFKQMPLHYQKQANWLTNHYHGIKYDSGDIHINDLIIDMYPKMLQKVILIKGIEKMSWLQYIFRDYGEALYIKNIEDLDQFDISTKNSRPYEMCSYHSAIFTWSGGPCAKSNALMLQDLTIKNNLESSL